MWIGIIADDLTGAMDSGVQFARAGYRTGVAFHGAPLPPADDLDAVAVETDSRSLDPPLAAGRVSEAGRKLRTARLAYKKLDSSLRGPIGAELEAFLRAIGRNRTVIAPAFPDAGRTTKGGVQLVFGEPVHETELARDPRTPVRTGHIPTLLSKAGLISITTLSLEDLDDTESVQRALDEYRWVVADAAEDRHLETLVRAVRDPLEVLWAGSAGLARALGAVYPGPHRGIPEVTTPARRVLAVVGSMSETSREQLRRLSTAAAPVRMELPPDAAPVEKALEEARSAFGEGNHVVLYPDAGGSGGAGDDLAGRIVAALAEVSGRLADEELFDALVLTGGDTAVHVARRLGAQGILLEKEVESGVPAGTLLGPCPYRVVTKAGGFGSPETLLEALYYLLGEGKD